MMINWNNEVNELAANILTSANPVKFFFESKNTVMKYRPIVLLFDGNSVNDISISEYENNDYKIKNLCNYKKTTVLNYETISSPSKTFQRLQIAHLVCLDSNIISRLPAYFSNKGTEQLNSFIDYLISERINISALPYMIEDSFNSSGMKNNIKVYNCVLYYAVLRRLSDGMPYSDKRLLPNDYIAADEMSHVMQVSRANEINYERRAKAIYCFLLKTFLIRFSSNKSAENKTKQLIDFCNNELGIYLESGTVLAYLYFENKNGFVRRFFQKVTPSSNDCLRKIEGMAWDLYHLWDMPTEISIQSHNNTVFLQSLATGDKPLSDLIDVNPIERIFMYNGEAIAKYKYNIDSFISNTEIRNSIISADEKRAILSQKVNLEVLSKKLENELLHLFDKF